MPGTRNSYLAFFMSSCRLFADLRERFLRAPLGHQLVLVKQIDRLLDEGGLIVFQVQTEFLQPLGMAIADPALQPAVGFLLAFHVLALPLGIVLRHIHLHFLAHTTLLTKRVELVISHPLLDQGRRNDTPL